MKFLPLISLVAAAYAAESAENTEAAIGDVTDVQVGTNASAEKPTLDMTANGVRILPRFEDTK
jgi:hypothetical protein